MSKNDSLRELRRKRAALADEARELADLPTITPGQDERLSRLVDGIDRLDVEIARATADLKATVTERTPGHDSPTFWRKTSKAEVFTAEARDAAERADLARRAVDVVAEAGVEVRSDALPLLSKSPAYADQFRAASDPNYASAWSKILAYGEAGALLKMSDAERSAVARVALAERAMSTTDANGGFLIPTLLDPMITLNNAGSAGNLRSVARVVTGVSDVWRGVASTGVTASWDAEGEEVSDDSPTLIQPAITAHRLAAFVPMSFEVMEDAESLMEQMRVLLADAQAQAEADAFINGDGSGKPFGLVTRLEANTAADVITTTAGTIGAVDVYNLMSALPPRFRGNSTFAASLSVLNEIRTISDDKLGNYVTDLRNGYSFSLLGRPVLEASYMDSMTNNTSAATFVAVGDFSKAYTIFDRLGSSRVSVVPHLFGTTNGRPTGQAGIYYYTRVGGDVLSGSTSGEQGARILVNSTS